eukprot:XP_020393601.1 vegetative cell wall protein gp1-like [Zea mays]
MPLSSKVDNMTKIAILNPRSSQSVGMPWGRIRDSGTKYSPVIPFNRSSSSSQDRSVPGPRWIRPMSFETVNQQHKRVLLCSGTIRRFRKSPTTCMEVRPPDAKANGARPSLSVSHFATPATPSPPPPARPCAPPPPARRRAPACSPPRATARLLSVRPPARPAPARSTAASPELAPARHRRLLAAARPPARRNAPPRSPGLLSARSGASTTACSPRACLHAPPPPARRLATRPPARPAPARSTVVCSSAGVLVCSAASPSPGAQPPHIPLSPFRPARYLPSPAPPVTVVASVYLLDGAAMEL